MYKFPNSHILTLNGSPRQRGRIHGETMRNKIQELIGAWKNNLVQEEKDPPEQYFKELTFETRFMKAIEKWTPDLLEEVYGIAEGAALDFPTIFAFQLQDEEWWFGQEKKTAIQNQSRGCSSIGWKRTPSSPSIVAQNMDMPDYLDNYQVILHIKDDRSEVESLVFSVCGLLALNGINNQSIGVVCNNLSQLNHSDKGLPVAYVHRGVLEKKTFSESKSFLKSIQHASGQNYLIGSPTRIIDLECSANQVSEYIQPESDQWICHTNHPFVNTDFRENSIKKKSTSNILVNYLDMLNIDSCTRYDVISQQLGSVESSETNMDLAKKILCSHDSDSHPVCRHSTDGLRWMTLGTSIMSLDEQPQFFVFPGPPCTSKGTRFSFNS